jgi:hypothetical protein
MESNVIDWRKQKELLKIAKSDSRAFRGPKAGKSAFFTHPRFFIGQTRKRSVQITRVKTVIPTLRIT